MPRIAQNCYFVQLFLTPILPLQLFHLLLAIYLLCEPSALAAGVTSTWIMSWGNK